MFVMALFTFELIGLVLLMITACGRIFMTSSAIPGVIGEADEVLKYFLSGKLREGQCVRG